jgi:hypothetical protein
MKKTLSDISAKEFLFQRIDMLDTDCQSKWGRMNVNQMLRHLNDAAKLATGKITLNFKSRFLQRALLKNLILWGMPAPKGKAKTFNEIDIVAKRINPKDLNSERVALKQTIEEFLLFGEKNEYCPHPAFGKMTGKQWKKLVYAHVDHHLKQFGV